MAKRSKTKVAEWEFNVGFIVCLVILVLLSMGY